MPEETLTAAEEQEKANHSTLESITRQFNVDDVNSAPDDPTLKDEDGNIKTGKGEELDKLLGIEQPEKSKETEPEKTPEDKDKEVELYKKKAAAFENNYKAALKKLEQLNPGQYSQIKSEIKQEAKQTQIDSPKTATEITDAEDYLTVGRAAEVFDKILESKFSAYEQRSGQQAQHQAVDNYCGKIINDFQVQNNISDEQVAAAIKEVAHYGIDTSTPKGMQGLTRAILKELTIQAVDSNYSNEVTKAAEDAAQKAKDLQKVRQPSPAPMPTPDQTRNQKLMDLMKSPSQKAMDDFFKGSPK